MSSNPFCLLFCLPRDGSPAFRLNPYSPELNPIERLWLYLRRRHWSNRTFADLDAVVEAAVAGWRAVCLDPTRVRSICRCGYAGACE
jgi:transposase